MREQNTLDFNDAWGAWGSCVIDHFLPTAFLQVQVRITEGQFRPSTNSAADSFLMITDQGDGARLPGLASGFLWCKELFAPSLRRITISFISGADLCRCVVAPGLVEGKK